MMHDTRSAVINEVVELGAARKLEQAVFGRRVVGARERAFYVFVDSVRIVALVLVDSACLVGIEIGIGETSAPLLKQAQRVIEIVVIPVDGSGVEISAGLSRRYLWNPFPVRSGLRKLIAVGIDIANTREDLSIARIGLQQIVFDPGGDGRIGGIEVRQGAIHGRSGARNL